MTNISPFDLQPHILVEYGGENGESPQAFYGPFPDAASAKTVADNSNTYREGSGTYLSVERLHPPRQQDVPGDCPCGHTTGNYPCEAGTAGAGCGT